MTRWDGNAAPPPCGSADGSGRAVGPVPRLGGIDHPGLVFAALFVLAAAPVLTCDLLPLLDYSNHLARVHLLAALPRMQTLGEFYALHWAPLPNLAMDAVVPPLLRVMPLAWAGKAF